MYKAKKILSSVIITLLVLTLVFDIIVVGYYTDWFSDFEKSESEVLSSGGLVVTVDEEHNDEVIQSGSGIFIDTVRLSGTQTLYSDSPYLSQVLSATVFPENAPDKSVEWSVAFVNASSSWAMNKNVDDYVQVVPEVENGLIANVYCYRPFAERIKITVTSLVNSSAAASCIVDFQKKVSEFSTLSDSYLANNAVVSSYIIGNGQDYIDRDQINLAGGIFVPADFNATNLLKSKSMKFNTVYSDYTLDDETTLSYYSESSQNYYYYNLQISEAFCAALNGAGITCQSSNRVTMAESTKLVDIIAAMVGNTSFDVFLGTNGVNVSKFNAAASVVSRNADSVDFSITVCVRTTNYSCDYKYDFKFDSSDSYLSVSNVTLNNSSITF